MEDAPRVVETWVNAMEIVAEADAHIQTKSLSVSLSSEDHSLSYKSVIDGWIPSQCSRSAPK